MKKKAKKRAEKIVPYFWFQGASVAELLLRLNEAGPNARLEVRPVGKKCTLAVVAAPEQAVPLAPRPPINESHVCPPVCG